MSTSDALIRVKRTIKPWLPRPAVQFYDRIQRRRLFRHEVRRDDLFIVGHPKSGNTWLTYMLAVLMQKDFGGNVSLANIHTYAPAIHGYDLGIARFAGLQSPRFFRNEYPLYPLLYPRTVYLVRDPRAALVSYFHMYRTLVPESETTMSAFVGEYLTDGCIHSWEPKLTRWDRQVEEWVRRARQDSRIMIIKYEDLVADRRGVLAALIDFACLSCSEREMDLAVDRGSFESMRSLEEERGYAWYSGEARERGRFVRRGRVDGWKDELPAEACSAIEAELGPVMKTMGYL